MKFLYFIIFVVISVNAYEDDIYFDNTTGKPVGRQEAPYFVAIKEGNKYTCNGVILTKFYVLTSASCIDLQETSMNTVVVYNATKFKSQTNYWKSVEDIHIFRDHGIDVLYKMVALKVNSSFEFDPFVNMITLPHANAVVPNPGTIFVRGINENQIDECLLLSKEFPPASLKFQGSSSVMVFAKVTGEQKVLMNGGPYVINRTLYGIIYVQSDVVRGRIEQGYLSLLNIPSAVDILLNLT